MATPANAENDALVKTLADLLAEVEVDTLGERRTKENAEAQEGTQAKKITKCKLTRLATYCSSWRLTRNLDTSVEGKAERGPHIWPNIRPGEDLVFGEQIN